MSFLPLKDLLSRSVRAAGISGKVQAAQTIAACRRACQELLPPAVARQVEPLFVRDGVLTVKAYSSAAAHELRLREGKVLARLNAESPLPVERLTYRLEG